MKTLLPFVNLVALLLLLSFSVQGQGGSPFGGVGSPADNFWNPLLLENGVAE